VPLPAPKPSLYLHNIYICDVYPRHNPIWYDGILAKSDPTRCDAILTSGQNPHAGSLVGVARGRSSAYALGSRTLLRLCVERIGHFWHNVGDELSNFWAYIRIFVCVCVQVYVNMSLV